MSNKVKIGISSCLLGNNVRYDGGGRLDQFLIDSLGRIAAWVPICPEVGAGFPVPRDPMRLVTDGPGTRLMTIDSGHDMTEAMNRWIEGILKSLEHEDVRGFVLKARSPSCGVHDAELFSSAGALSGRRAGLFAEAVKRHFPSLPVEDEERLRDPFLRAEFLARISA